jgi:hypothetical protein
MVNKVDGVFLRRVGSGGEEGVERRSEEARERREVDHQFRDF